MQATNSQNQSEILKKVIVALDYEDVQQAENLVETIGDRVQWYKLGPILFTRHGERILKHLQGLKKKIFVDLKFYDTPNVVAETLTQLADLGVDLASVHCLGGRTMLEAAGAACRSTQLELVGVTLLTSQGAPDSMNWGWPQDELQMVERLATLAMEARLTGAICSPREIEHLRRKTPPGFQLFVPGIRFAGQEVYRDDQRRIATPREAVELGANYIVIGRPITQAPDPNRVLDQLLDPTLETL